MAPVLFTLMLLAQPCVGFFQNAPLQLNTIKPRLNLTCSSDANVIDDFTDCEYCVFEFFNNGTDSSISHDCIILTNSYRLVARRCTGFTNTSDVGYGVCSPLPFEHSDIALMCICATDRCNENFATCKQSVDSNPPLPALPSPIPSLTAQASSIQCQDTALGILNSTYYCERDSTPYINLTECERYVQNHTVLCMYRESDNGNYLTVVALPDEDYEYVLAEQIQTMQQMAVKPTTIQSFNETNNAFYIQWKDRLEASDNTTMIYNRCYCMTSNCNINLTACLQSNIIVKNTAYQGKHGFSLTKKTTSPFLVL